MAANSTNRETIRDRIAVHLGDLVTNNQAQSVYSGKVADFEGRSPVVVVTSGGSEREYRYLGSDDWHNWFTFTIWVFVSYAVGDQEAEDRLDLIEKEIADIVMDNRSDTGFWEIIEFDGVTDAGADVIIGGTAYRREVIPVKVRVAHG